MKCKQFVKKFFLFFQHTRLTIRLLLFLVLFVLVCLPMAIFSFLSISLSESSVAEAIKANNTGNLQLLEQNFETIFSGIIDNAICTADQLLADGALEQLSNDNQYLATYLQDNFDRNDYIHSANVYVLETNSIYHTDSFLANRSSFFSRSLYKMIDRRDSIIYQLTYYDPEECFWVSKPHRIRTDPIPMFGLSFIVPIIQQESQEIKGYLSMTVDCTAIMQDFTSFFDLQNNDFIFYDRSDAVFLSNRTHYMDSETLQSLAGYSGVYINQNSSDIYTVDGNRVLITSMNTHLFDLSILMTTPYSFVENSLSQNQQSVFSSLLLGVALSLFFSIVVSSLFSRPLLTLKHNMDLFAQGDLSIKNKSFGNNEIADLSNSFNRMTDEIVQLLRNLDSQKAFAENYRLRLINEQTNPHFLYNVLEMISSLIHLEMCEEANVAIHRLGRFYRTSLSDGADLVAVSAEVQNLKDYLFLQKMRYDDLFDVSLEVDPAVENCLIPKLTLQPLAENAIYHGMRKKRSKSQLCIKVYAKDERLFISVWDNGVGMSQEKVKELLNLQYVAQLSNHFGISSIVHRLNYHYNYKVSLHIESEEQKFTHIALSVPITTNNQLTECDSN